MKKVIRKVVNSKLCTGCMACVSICKFNALNVVINNKGFMEPKIDTKKCIHCGICEKVCPRSGTRIEPQNILKTYVFKANDEKRKMSQSGAGFAVVAENVIKSGGVVYGACLDDSMYCKYTRAETIDALNLIKKSKYVSADIRGIYGQVEVDLITGKTVLFSGTPCYVDGLKKYLQVKKINIEKLYLAGLICHGTPSPMIFSDYLQYYSRMHDNMKITGFNFRDKRFGWYGHVTIGLGKTCMVNDDYSSIFYSRYTQRDSCYECPYSNLNRVEDITFGDAWGIEKVMPSFDDGKGVSLVLISSAKGEKLWIPAQEEGACIEVRIEDFLQPNLVKPTEAPQNRDSFWEDYKNNGFSYTINNYCLINGGFKEYEYLLKNQYIKRAIRKVSRSLERSYGLLKNRKKEKR